MKRLIVVLLLLAGFFAIRPSLDDTLKSIVEDVFTKGTGCNTTIQSAHLQFIPIGATAENAAIRCEGENAPGGFTAKKVSIRIDPLQLLGKKIYLQDLHISGAQVVSIGTKSALIKTVEFVTEKPAPKPNAKKSWHSFISTGWKVELSGLEISSAPQSAFDTPRSGPEDELWQSPDLTIGVDDFEFVWKDVRFTATHTERKYPFSRLFARAGGFGVKRRDAGGISLGYIDAGVSIENGRLEVIHAYTRYGPPAGQPQVSRLTAEGGMNIRDRTYDFRAKADLYPEFLATLLPAASKTIFDSELKASIDGTVTGKLSDPILTGDFNFRVASPLAMYEQEACAFKRIDSKFKLTTDLLHLYDIQIGDLISSSDVSLQLLGDYAFTADLDYAINRSSPFVEKCLAATDSSGEQWLDVTLRNAVANSRGNVAARGTVSPLFANGTWVSHFHSTDVSDKATLKSTFNLSDGKLSVSLKERGDVAQVRESPIIDEGAATARSTTFQTTTNANIDLVLAYYFGSGKLGLEKCRVKRYPLSRLLARLAPFMPQRVLANASDFVTEDSLLDLNFKLSRDAADKPWIGNGTINARSLEYHGFPVTSLDAPFSMQGGALEISEITATSAFGQLNGSIALGAKDTLSGTLRLDVPDLSYVPWWKDVMPDMTAALQGVVELQGTTDSPNIKGELQIQPSTDLDSPIELVSYTSFKTESGALIGDAELFGKRASATWSYPLSEDSKKPLKIEMRADKFPISVLLPSHIRKLLSEQVSDQNGSLSGTLIYSAAPPNLNRGNGELTLDELTLQTPSARIRNPQPIYIDIVEGTFKFNDLILLANDRELSIKGSAGAVTGWNVDLSSNWELGALTSMIRQVEQLSGELELNASIYGDFDSPRLAGSAKLRKGTASMKLDETFIGANKLEGEIRIADDSLLLERLEGQVGQGHLIAQGRLDQLFSPTSRNGVIEIVATEVSIQPSDVINIRFSGYSDIVLEPSLPPLIKGEIEILGALYERNVSLGDIIEAALSLLRDQQSVKVKRGVAADRDSTRLDVRLHAGESLQIESDLLKTTMRGDVRIGGTTLQPTVEGDIQVLEGSFGLSSSKFDILSGSITFPKNSLVIDPEISFAAETVVQTSSREEHRVLLTLGGTARNPDVGMSTDSGMSEREIVGLLNIGGSTGSLSLLSWEQGRDDYTYAELLSPKTDISLRNRLKSLLGFSRFEIETRRRVETNELIPRVAGSREVTPDLSFTLYSDLGGSSNEQGAKLDYELTPYVGAFAEWRSEPYTKDESSAGVPGAGLIFRRNFPGTGILPRQLVEE
ncbi:MAG: translocation/assembly module TamB domain-containing protein [Bdellovibrionales bacterium]|nr:translocation/assembly module TamB domain-containing protein [Bdellovibrionales bacterium]